MGYSPYNRFNYWSFNGPNGVYINDNRDDEYGYMKKDLQIFNKKCCLDIYLGKVTDVVRFDGDYYYSSQHRLRISFNIETNRLIISSNLTNYDENHITKIIDEMIFHSLMY